MVKILHAADFHLDSAFAALSEEHARQRRRESRQLVSRMVDYANDHGVELMLLAGDLFDGERVYTETLEEVAAALGRFRGQVLVAPGNHDYYGLRSPYARILWPENVHIFKENRWGKVSFPQYGCAVWGTAFTAPEMEALTENLTCDGEGVQLLVFHGDVGAVGSRYRAISHQWLANSGAHYAALGHVHEYRGIQRAGSTDYAYCGCPEGRGFDELGAKGFLVGEVDEQGAHLQFVPFAGREYHILPVDVTGREILPAVRDALQGREADICRVILRGETEPKPDVAALEEELAGLVWQLEVRDETRLQRDIWQGWQEETLRGLFLRQLRSEYETADEERRAVIEQAVRYGLAAMENREL